MTTEKIQNEDGVYRGARDGRIQVIGVETEADIAYWSAAFGVSRDELFATLRACRARDAAAGHKINIPGLD